MFDVSSQILSLYTVKESDAGKKLPSNTVDALVHGKHQVTTLCNIPFVSCAHFCKRLQFIFKMLAVQIDLFVVTAL